MNNYVISNFDKFEKKETIQLKDAIDIHSIPNSKSEEEFQLFFSKVTIGKKKPILLINLIDTNYSALDLERSRIIFLVGRKRIKIEYKENFSDPYDNNQYAYSITAEELKNICGAKTIDIRITDDETHADLEAEAFQRMARVFYNAVIDENAFVDVVKQLEEEKKEEQLQEEKEREAKEKIEDTINIDTNNNHDIRKTLLSILIAFIYLLIGGLILLLIIGYARLISISDNPDLGTKILVAFFYFGLLGLALGAIISFIQNNVIFSLKNRRWKIDEEYKKKMAMTCPKCSHYPFNKNIYVISKKDVYRDVKHIFYQWVKIGDRDEKRAINVALEPQKGIEIMQKEIFICPICGYKKESTPTKTYKWNGPEEIRDYVN